MSSSIIYSINPKSNEIDNNKTTITCNTIANKNTYAAKDANIVFEKVEFERYYDNRINNYREQNLNSSNYTKIKELCQYTEKDTEYFLDIAQRKFFEGENVDYDIYYKVYPNYKSIWPIYVILDFIIIVIIFEIIRRIFYYIISGNVFLKKN